MTLRTQSVIVGLNLESRFCGNMHQNEMYLLVMVHVHILHFAITIFMNSFIYLLALLVA